MARPYYLLFIFFWVGYGLCATPDEVAEALRGHITHGMSRHWADHWNRVPCRPCPARVAPEGASGWVPYSTRLSHSEAPFGTSLTQGQPLC